jgi:HK97 gp10 family phage protein
MAGSVAKISGHRMVLDTTVLDRITAEMKPKAARIVKQYGNMVTATAMKNAPVDTGALMNSIGSESQMTDELTFTVQDGVEYGVYQEFGTSKMAAQPFLVPAIEAWADRFYKAFEGLFK